MMNNSKVLNTNHTAKRLLAHLLENPQIIPVWDLDGVLLDASHRIDLRPDGSLDLDKYRANTTHDNVMKDRNLPLMSVIHALNELERPYYVATARVLCQHSQALLRQRAIRPVAAISRGETDYRKDWDLKVAGIHNTFSINQFKDILLIDDCPSNCDSFINALGANAINIDYPNSPKPWLQALL